VSAEDIFGYISRRAGRDLSAVFDQYFRTTTIPELELELSEQGERLRVNYRWNAETKGFDLPVKVTMAPEKFELIYPTREWQEMVLTGMDSDEFKVAEREVYIEVSTTWEYVLPDIGQELSPHY